MQNAIIREKTKKTNLERYGVEYLTQSEEIKNKMKKNYFQKNGVEYPMQNENVRNKSKITSLERYGVEYALQNPEISEKASKKAYKLKEYILPSENVIKLQGYENFAMNDLFQKENLNENDIITSRIEVPEVWYNDSVGKKHRYYVDIYIPSQNRCIEVKSTWTMKKKQDIIFLKHNAMKNKGFNCEIWVYNCKGDKVNSYK